MKTLRNDNSKSLILSMMAPSCGTVVRRNWRISFVLTELRMGIKGLFSFYKDKKEYRVYFGEAISNGDIIYAVLDGNNFVKYVNEELLCYYKLNFVNYEFIYRIIMAFDAALKKHHIEIKSICYDCMKEPAKIGTYEKRCKERRKNIDEKVRVMLDRKPGDHYGQYPMLHIVRWMIMDCLKNQFKQAKVYYGGTISDLYYLTLELRSRFIARVCGESGIVISDDNDFLLMPIRGVLKICLIFSERTSRQHCDFESFINQDFDPFYYSLSGVSEKEKNALYLECYKKGNDYFLSVSVSSLDEVRDTERYRAFLSYYSAEFYPTDEWRFLVSSVNDKLSRPLNEGELEVLRMDLSVTPDPMNLVVSSLVRRMECITPLYRNESRYIASISSSVRIV